MTISNVLQRVHQIPQYYFGRFFFCVDLLQGVYYTENLENRESSEILLAREKSGNILNNLLLSIMGIYYMFVVVKTNIFPVMMEAVEAYSAVKTCYRIQWGAPRSSRYFRRLTRNTSWNASQDFSQDSNVFFNAIFPLNSRFALSSRIFPWILHFSQVFPQRFSRDFF